MSNGTSRPARGNRIPVRLTPAGRQILRDCATAVMGVEESLGLDREQAGQLNSLLHAVAAGAVDPSQ
jgi:DNA-binding transcriptional LysR family regulator